MKPFVVNQHGRLVFPSNFLPELDVTVLESVEQLDATITRDLEAKAPTGTDILERVRSGAYGTRYGLLRDVALNLLWVNRYAITMYEKRPTRWRDVPRRRDDLFLPVLTPWEGAEEKIAAVAGVFDRLDPGVDPAAEDAVFRLLFDVFAHRRYHATELPAIKPTVAEMLEQPERMTLVLDRHDPDFPTFTPEAIQDCSERAPELEALHRLAMVIHNQYPWDRAGAKLQAVGTLRDDDVVVLFAPRSPDVRAFLRRARRGGTGRPRPAQPPEPRVTPAPSPPVDVRRRFDVLPRLEALAVVRGEHACTNEDLIRNTAYNWSPMTAEDISRKTGIQARRYTERRLDEIALQAADAALRHAGRAPEEVGAVLVCTCTSTTLIPSIATWISGQLGIYQTHASYDLVAACAGFPYGLAEATRLLQEVRRPVLVVCAEKFSDKIGTVRTSRMIFGDGAAAVVVAPAEGADADLEVLQTYASGPASQVNSIIWPNPEFDGNITVYGPEVRNLAGRYLVQMIEELEELPHPAGDGRSLLDAIELIVPHQANQTMVTELARDAGIAADRLFFNIRDVGNLSAASIPVAVHDAVRDGVIERPLRVFAPGFGAGAVAGYAVLRIDPAIVVPERPPHEGARFGVPARSTTTDDALVAFGG